MAFLLDAMPRPKRNFAPMPLAALAADITPQEKLFILAIMHHDWDGEKAWPSMDRLTRITGFKKRTLQEAARALEARGWMVTETRGGYSNTYRLDLPDMTLDAFNDAIKTPARGAQVDDETHAPGAPLPMRHVPTNESHRNESHKDHPADAGALTLHPPSSTTKRTLAKGKAPWAATDGTGWQTLVEDYAAAFAVAKKDPAAKPDMTPADFAQLKRLAVAKAFTRAEYQRRLANMGLHDFHARQEFSLAYFCTRWREFADDAEGIKRARGGGRGGRYMAVEKVEDFHGD